MCMSSAHFKKLRQLFERVGNGTIEDMEDVERHLYNLLLDDPDYKDEYEEGK